MIRFIKKFAVFFIAALVLTFIWFKTAGAAETLDAARLEALAKRLNDFTSLEADFTQKRTLARILHEPQKNRPASRSVFLVNGCVTAKKNGHPCYNFVCSKNNNKNDHVLLFYPN